MSGLGRRQPGGLRRELRLVRRLRPQAQPVPGGDRLRRRLLVVPVRERRRPRRPRVAGVRVERPQLRQLARRLRRRDVLREQVHHGCELVGEGRVVLRQQPGRGQEVAVVEVVVVELVRAEGRREADGRPGGLVVDHAPGVAPRAPVGLGPLPQGVGGRGRAGRRRRPARPAARRARRATPHGSAPCRRSTCRTGTPGWPRRRPPARRRSPRAGRRRCRPGRAAPAAGSAGAKDVSWRPGAQLQVAVHARVRAQPAVLALRLVAGAVVRHEHVGRRRAAGRAVRQGRPGDLVVDAVASTSTPVTGSAAAVRRAVAAASVASGGSAYQVAVAPALSVVEPPSVVPPTSPHCEVPASAVAAPSSPGSNAPPVDGRAQRHVLLGREADERRARREHHVAEHRARRVEQVDGHAHRVRGADLGGGCARRPRSRPARAAR